MYIYTMEYYSAIKKKMLPFAATWMDLELITLSKVSRKETNTIGYYLHVESKMWHKLIYETEMDSEGRLSVM